MITAAAHNGISASVVVHVYIPVEELTINGTSNKLWTAEHMNSMQLTLVFSPDNATYKTVSWSSSAPEVAGVDQNGLVTAVSPGTATITATTTDPSAITTAYSITVGDGTMTAFILPSALRMIEEEAFYNAGGIQYIILGNQVVSIGDRAFAEMESLNVIKIPASINDISLNAFEGSTPVILCENGSYAHQYAIENSIPYIISDD